MWAEPHLHNARRDVWVMGPSGHANGHSRTATIYRKEVGLFSLIASGLEAFRTRWPLGSLKRLCLLSGARQWPHPH